MCTASSKKEMEVRAEAKVHGISRPTQQNDRLQMRKVVEGVHDAAPDDEYPAAQYLTIKLEEVELNEPQAGPLDDMAHMDHVLDNDITLALDVKGAIRTQTKKRKVDVPMDTEQYRRRMRVERSCA